MSAGTISFHELHYTRSFREKFFGSLSEPIARITICSPFFDQLPKPFNDVIGFCSFMQRRGTEIIQIITRPPDEDRQAMSLDTAKILAAQGVTLVIRSDPYLHAKMYHFEYARGYFRTFVGSANFTLGGLDRNHEIVAEVLGTGDGTACHREIARMTSRGAQSFHAWVARNRPSSEEGTP